MTAITASIFAASVSTNDGEKISPESLALLAKPLTKSTAEKVWPKNGARGIITAAVAEIKGNSQDPGEFLNDGVFQKFKKWGVNCVQVALEIDTGSKWDIEK